MSSWEFLSLIMSSYQEFTELTMTDSGRGFSNPAYHDNTSAQENTASSSPPSVATVQSNGKTVSRSNSIGEDPDHIEVLKMILHRMKNHDLCVRCHWMREPAVLRMRCWRERQVSSLITMRTTQCHGRRPRI